MIRFHLAAATLIVATPLAIAGAAQDWSASVTKTAAGSFVRGNPKASAKLVEYISYTCPHCAHFYGEAEGELARRIKTGGTSVELRHAVRDPMDMTAALLARCGGGRRFFGNTAAILAAQKDWATKAAAWQGANLDKIKTMSTTQRLQGYAANSGLTAMMRGRGYSAAQLNACLANTAEQDVLTKQAEAAWQVIRGTPSFTVNGTLVPGANSWATLEPALIAAGSR